MKSRCPWRKANAGARREKGARPQRPARAALRPTGARYQDCNTRPMVQVMSPSAARSSLRSYRAYNAVAPWNPHPRLLGAGLDDAGDATSGAEQEKSKGLYRLPAEL